MIPDQQVEEIVLLVYLTGMALVDAAYAVVPDFDRADFEVTAALTIQIKTIQKKLDAEIKKTHS